LSTEIMRAKISIVKVSDGVLPYDYQYALACMLYDKLAVGDVQLANQTHFHQGFKFYDFSNLLLDNYRSCPQGLLFDRADLIITSPDPVFVKTFAQGLLQRPEFHLHGQICAVTEIEVLKQRQIPSTCCFRTLSPIFVKTVRERDGNLVEWDLYPKDGKFHENVHHNLVKRYTEYYGQPPDSDHFEIIRVHNFKAKRIRIGGGPEETQRRCSLMTFTAQGSPELLQFAYDAGLGEKNAMGFGCLEVVDAQV